MLCSLLSLPVDVVRRLDQYSLEFSTGISPALQTHVQWTIENFPDADRASSLLQAQWMLQKSRDMGARRVLDIGCYTGLSAVAWYEGTAASRGQITTIEMDEILAAKAQARFQSTGHSDRIRIIQASAEDALQQLNEPYDIIFVDLEFSAYKPIVSQILDRNLLAQGGVILVDNVFARSFAVSSSNTTNLPEPLDLEHWEQAGKLVREFNTFVASDPRVEVNVLPIFDAINYGHLVLRGNHGELTTNLVLYVMDKTPEELIRLVVYHCLVHLKSHVFQPVLVDSSPGRLSLR